MKKFHIYTNDATFLVEADGYENKQDWLRFYRVTETGTETARGVQWSWRWPFRKTYVEQRSFETRETLEWVRGSLINRLIELPRDSQSKPGRAETPESGSVHESPGAAEQQSPK